jgi:hypothetical protein
MSDWDEVLKAIFPIKKFEELYQRISASLRFRFVHYAYNFSLPELEHYTQLLLGGDPRGRYTVYNSKLKATIRNLHLAGIRNVIDLSERTKDRQHMELLAEFSTIPAPEIAEVLKYLVYWVIPGSKYLSGLVQNDYDNPEAIPGLRSIGIRTNLELLQAGLDSRLRKELARKSRLPDNTILELTNRADFSRLPWSRKATISNIMCAGYTSLVQLANANPEKLVADFFAYGKSIGKNLKLGNEIESSFRIAKIIPKVLIEDQE